MTRARAIAGGLALQAALLFGATLPISHADPPSALALVSGVAIGFAGGFVAGRLHRGPAASWAVGLPVSGVGGLAFALLLYYRVVTDTARGVFWHFHYLLAITVPPPLVVDYGRLVVVAFAALAGCCVFGFGMAGYWLAPRPDVGLPD